MKVPITPEQKEKLSVQELNQRRMVQNHKILDFVAQQGHGSVTFYFGEPGVSKEKPRWNYVFNTDKSDRVLDLLETQTAIDSFCESEKELGPPFANNIKEIPDPLQDS